MKYKQNLGPKKILYLTFHPEIGGGETILLSLLTKLNKKKFEPIVIVTKKGQLYKRLRDLNIKTYIVPLNGYLIRTLFIPGTSPSGIYQFYKLCKKIKPNLIHLNHLNLAIYAGITAKILKIPLVATAHGQWDTLYFFQDIISAIFTNKIFANSLILKNNLLKRKILNSKKVNFVPFGIDTNKFKPAAFKNIAKKKLGLSEKDFVISIVGRLDPVKDHITFLKAAKIISSTIPDSKFLIVGSKSADFSSYGKQYYSQIQHFLIENAKLSKKIVFIDFTENMPLIYQATNILVSTSKSESFGLSLLEASSCAVPVIATNNGSQNMIIKENLTGYLVKPQNYQKVASKIIMLYENPSLTNKLGKNGRKYSLSIFNLPFYVKSIEKSYKELIS